MHAAVRVGDLHHEGRNEFISVLSWNVPGQLTQRAIASYLRRIDYVIQLWLVACFITVYLFSFSNNKTLNGRYC